MLSVLKSVALVFALVLAVPLAGQSQTLGTINFDFDSDVLDAAAQQQIVAIAEQLKTTNSYKPTVVVGYTDAVGSGGYNQDLGLRRARRVADALVAAGAPVDRIGSIESRGKNELLVAVASPERRNRRVTVSMEDILAACRSYRNVNLSQSSIGNALQADLVTRMQTAYQQYDLLQASGGNGSAFQMAGAAREDCSQAVAYKADSVRKLEYSKRCFCSSARMQVALGNIPPAN